MLKCTTARRGNTVKVTFTLPADEVRQPVSVLGDFNGWDPSAHQLKRRRNGMLSATVELQAGQELRFKYLGADGHWFCDPNADTVVHGEHHTIDSLLVV